VSLTCSAGSETALAIEAMLEAVGFVVDTELPTLNEMITKVYVNRDYEMTCAGSDVSNAAPSGRLERFWGTGNYFTGFSDPAFDAAVTKIRRAGTRDDMKAAIAEMQHVWNETMPDVPLVAIELASAYLDRVHGLAASLYMSPIFADAWVDQ
jgi:ABC-type transport system substrate-binding protein